MKIHPRSILLSKLIIQKLEAPDFSNQVSFFFGQMVINNRGSMVTVSGKDPDEMARLVEGVAYLNTRHAITHSIYNSSKSIFPTEGVRV